MRIITRDKWGALDATKCVGRHTPKRIVLHHSWSPTKAQFKGEATIRGIQRFHMVNNGWHDIGYHFIISPDGSQVFEGHPVNQISYHCGGNPPAGSNRVFGNTGSIGICLIGNYDTEMPEPTAVLVLQSLINELCQTWSIKPDQVLGHFEAWTPSPPKTCPGRNIAEAFGMLTRWKLAFLCN